MCPHWDCTGGCGVSLGGPLWAGLGSLTDGAVLAIGGADIMSGAEISHGCDAQLCLPVMVTGTGLRYQQLRAHTVSRDGWWAGYL